MKFTDEIDEALTFGWRKKIRPILQNTSAECGLACLSMILRFHGHEVQLGSIRHHAGSSRGHTLKQIAEIASSYSLQTRPLRIDAIELGKIALPAIAHVNNDHFVVVERVARKRVHLVDPAIGRRRMEMRSFLNIFDGVILELQPSPAFSLKKEMQRESILRRFGRVPGITSSLIWIFILALSLEVTVLLAPLFVQTVVDVVLASKDFRLLGVIAIALLSLIFLQTVIGSFRTWAISVVGASLNAKWSSNVFHHLLRLEDKYFGTRHLGDIASRFGGLEVIQRTYSISSVEAALDGLLAIAILCLLFLYSKALSFIVIFGMFIYALVRLISLNVMVDTNIDAISAAARQESAFIESARTTPAIKLNGMTGERTSLFVNRVIENQHAGLRLASQQIVFGSVGTVLFGAIKVGTIFIGASNALSGSFTAGMLVAFIAYVDQFTGRCTKLIDFFISLKLVRTHIDRVADITEAPRERFEIGKFQDSLTDFSLTLSNISFGYESNALLLNVSSHIPYGQFVSVMGRSGCGKSTLVRVISGLNDPHAGGVLLGGVSTIILGKSRLREHVSIVLQKDDLFSGTIRDNICCFDSAPEESRVIECAKMAEIHADIMAMPMRYQTQIGDFGSLVSGGQLQRICIARALYRKPKILILDEAMSNLDTHTERSIVSNLVNSGMTLLVISHRPETVAMADRILLLENGVLVDLGDGHKKMAQVGSTQEADEL